jgi:methylmalonyl-CoA/ethylmalonyl-CoA epimerase
MPNLKEKWITALSSPQDGERAAAARRIYDLGRSLADSVVQRWSNDEEFAQLLGKDPEITVGLAVRPETFAQIREANGWPQLAEVPQEQDASEFALRFEGGGTTLDVLTSRDPEGSGAIANFLSKFGDGIQQVEFRCSDVNRAAAILRDQFAVASVYPEARPGADGTRVNFFLASSADGKKVLIELYEPAAIRFE